MTKFIPIILAAAIALVAAAPAGAHTLGKGKARSEARYALYVNTPASAYHYRVKYTDCYRWSRHKVICAGTYEKDRTVREYDSCKYISYYGNCSGGYDYYTETDYCVGMINVTYRPYSYRARTWVHSKECF